MKKRFLSLFALMVALSLIFNTGLSTITDCAKTYFNEDPRLPKEEGKYWVHVVLQIPDEDYPDDEVNNYEEYRKFADSVLDIKNQYRKSFLELYGISGVYFVETSEISDFYVYVDDELYETMSQSAFYNEKWVRYSDGEQHFSLRHYTSSFALDILRISVGLGNVYPSEWKHDLNNDSDITAEDALIALRISAGDCLMAVASDAIDHC